MPNQCIVSSIVYDWVTINESLKKVKLIPDIAKKCVIDDCICINFQLNCLNSEPSVIWQAIGMTVNTASFSVTHCGGCDRDLAILVNGEIVSTVSSGSTYRATVSNLETISIEGEGICVEGEECYGELEINVQYVAAEIDRHDVDIQCYLSNETGDPFHTVQSCGLHCKEVNSDRRLRKQFKSSDGTMVELYNVNLLMEGYITIKISKKGTDECLLICTFPITFHKSVLLCAPPENEIKCKITHFQCNVKVSEAENRKGCLEAIIELDFCLDVKSLYPSVIRVDADVCEPRDNFNKERSLCLY
ncbi:S-Ena type endospore appendage [Gracilibacillus xinjiangensis]|uniref:S-Ena type endospore appendage n=1 Tax=Gracilibacillus xinjiangensis TaxID=1193282 RepID=A0ABV8X0U6_9BACI